MRLPLEVTAMAEPVMIERLPYRCARGARCANRVRVDQPAWCPCTCHGMPGPYATCDLGDGSDSGCGHLHQPADPDAEPVFEGGAILTHTGLCMGCTTRVTRALDDLPTDYIELSLLLASGETGLTELVSSSSELKVPIRLTIEALQASLVHEAIAWAEPVAEQMGIEWDTHLAQYSRPGYLLQRAAQLLAHGIGTLITLPAQEYRDHASGDWVERDGIAGVLELSRLHDLVRFVSGKTKLVHELPAPCPRCERMTLVRHNGSDQVECERCGVGWPEESYKRLTLILADDYQDEAPLHERNGLVSAVEGTTGSAAGGDASEWPRLPMIEFPASA